MKKRFSEEKTAKILNEHKAGKKVKDVAREHGISENSFFSGS